MERTEQFDAVLAKLETQFPMYDQHVLRLHLLGYSVWNNILQTKIGWLLLKNIEWGFNGLLQNEVMGKLVLDDPLNLRSLADNQFDELRDLVSNQVNQFVWTPRERTSEYDSFFSLLNELSFTEPEAVVDTSSEAFKSEKLSLTEHFQKYFHAVPFEIEGKKFLVLPQNLTENSFIKYVSWHLDEFFLYARFHPSPQLIDLIVNESPIEDGDSIFSINSGIGSIILGLHNRFPQFTWLEVKTETRNLCENFLSDLNLWTIAHKIREQSVVLGEHFDEAVDDYASSRNDGGEKIEYDFSIGIVPEVDVINSKNIDSHFFRLSFGSENYENAYVELLLSVLSRKGKAAIAVPSRFLYSEDAKLLREYYLSRDYINTITDVPLALAPNSSAPFSIISFDFGKDPEQASRVIFVSGHERMRVTISDLKENNILLDMRPSRFLGSIEYQYREILDLFDDRRICSLRRPKMVKILKTLESDFIEAESFTQIRGMIEEILVAIKKKNPQRLPNVVFKLREGRITACSLYLNGEEDFKNPPRWSAKPKPFFPKHIGELVILCIRLGNIGAHPGRIELDIYAYRSATFALLTILKWFKDNFGRI